MVLDAVWSVAERKEMEEVVGLYGKTFHMWQIDRGDELPLGMPELMMSYTKPEQVSFFLLLYLAVYSSVPSAFYFQLDVNRDEGQAQARIK